MMESQSRLINDSNSVRLCRPFNSTGEAELADGIAKCLYGLTADVTTD